MVRKPKAAVLGVGAERGVGAGLSRRFAKEGYHVLVAGRTADKIEKVAETIRAPGGSATAIITDGTKEADVVALSTGRWPTMARDRRPICWCSTWATTRRSISAR